MLPKAVFESWTGCTELIRSYYEYAVRKITIPSDGAHVLKAAVMMEFPDFNLVDCVTILEIILDYVELLVRDLFGIEVENKICNTNIYTDKQAHPIKQLDRPYSLFYAIMIQNILAKPAIQNSPSFS